MNFGTKLYQRLAQRAQTQRELVALAHMNDRLLRDIGITRDEVRAQQMRGGFFV